jgi:hypothetical protein
MWWQPENYNLPTIENSIEKQRKFYCEFIDLKRNGYHHYTRALNDLSYGYWKPILIKTDDYVTKLADNMKAAINTKGMI